MLEVLDCKNKIINRIFRSLSSMIFVFTMVSVDDTNVAFAITPEELDAGFKLGVYGGSGYPAYGSMFYTNYAGANEKYLRGVDGWYYILPSGRLALWDQSFAKSKPIANLDPKFYEDPFLLTEAALRKDPQPSAKSLNDKYAFYLDPAGTYLNYAGWNEKYFRGKDDWYFILPNGTVYHWDPTFEKSEPLANLAPKYYHNLQLLFSGDDSNEEPLLVVGSPEDNESVPTPFPTTTTTTSSLTTTTLSQECSAYSIQLDGLCMYSSDLIRGGDYSTCANFDNFNQSYLKSYYGIYPSSFASCLNNLLVYPNMGSLTKGIYGHFYTSYLFTKSELDNFVYSYFAGARNPVVIYVDKDCNRVPATTNTCGGATTWTKGYFISPISLVWRENVEAGVSYSISQFPLDPNRVDMWYAWKGSADFPLLVVDPEHNGRIISATQLFGTSTFGKSWKNGYEALATLDSNRDGEISGAELSPLALWFDENRDGISQPGEVQSIQDTGVSVLYYKIDDIQLDATDLVATKGYKRIVDGKEVLGRSIDWFVHQAQTKGEALSSEDIRNAAAVSEQPKQLDQLTSRKSKFDSISIVPDGFWTWRLDDNRAFQGKGQPGGVLVFKSKGRKLEGVSLLETPLKNNAQGLRASITSFPLIGTINERSSGRMVLKYRATGLADVETVAYLSEDGKELKGRSRKIFAKARLKDGKPFVLEYSWTATKIRDL